MTFIVKPLTPELAIVFTEYLEKLDFSHANHWSTCFCRFYHCNCSSENWMKRSGKENRLEAIEEIKAGNMKGYLAFDGHKCIGWCNANNVQEYSRLEDDLKPYIKEGKVGCIICFVIDPEYREQGVARLLLKEAVEGFKSQGFNGVIALPVDIKNILEKRYRGTLNMYKELGFKELDKDDDVSVMWLTI